MTILLAVAVGVVVLLAGNWIAALTSVNLTHGTSVPWAIVPIGLWLWVYWQFLDGRWGADLDPATRRSNLRANRVPLRLWIPSLAAGLLGFAALLAGLSLAARVVEFPSGTPITTPPEMPAITVVLLLAMQSIMAGVTEEAAFRGYMQSLIERQHGLLVAIVVNGIVFGLLHFSSHPDAVLQMLPYYVAVAAVYGGLTWAADSILPAIVLHAGGDMVVLIRWWATGRPEWQLSATPPPLVSQTGIDAGFVMTLLIAIVFGVLTILSYRKVRALRVAARHVA
jgi:membrane protease YdiL (CAAX protease family)